VIVTGLGFFPAVAGLARHRPGLELWSRREYRSTRCGRELGFSYSSPIENRCPSEREVMSQVLRELLRVNKTSISYFWDRSYQNAARIIGMVSQEINNFLGMRMVFSRVF
jgi:hypothetical protein